MKTSTKLPLITAATIAATIALPATAQATCTDTSTGHFFRVSRDSYELG
jgi:hypothetical protein